MLADEKSKSLKVFCALCGKVYRDPHITSCGVSLLLEYLAAIEANSGGKIRCH